MKRITHSTKRNLKWLSALLLPLFVAGIFLSQTEELTKREKYEQFLLKKYAEVPQYSEEQLKEMPKPAHPDMAALQDYFMTLDPELGYVPKERLYQAYQETKAMRKNRHLKSTDMMEWTGTSVVMGGRTRAIMWDPNDPAGKKVWAGGVTGGLWYNDDITDDQSEWQPVNDFWSSLNIECITFDPNDPQTFYVGTGEAETAVIIYRESSGLGDGIWKSTDGGQTWNLLGSTTAFEFVTDIEVRDENGLSVIYAGVASGIYKGEQHLSEPSDGLFLSEDGGENWDQVLPDIPDYGEPYAVADIEIGPDGRIYVGTMPNVEIEGGATILWSDDGSVGTWTVYDDYVTTLQNQGYIPGRVIVSSAPSDENIVYACLAGGYTNNFVYYRGRYVIKSEDKGESWFAVEIPDDDWATLAWHAFIIKVNPTNPDHVITGGLDLWKTNNGGISWNRISDWVLMYYGGGDDYVHADQHAIEYKPGSSTEFITGDDGGVFYTTSATNTYPVFEQKNNGYNTLQFYTCDIDPQAGEDLFVGGLQDNGTLLYDGAPLSINDMIDGGDGAYCFIDDNEPEIWITSVYYNRYTVFINGNGYDYLNYYSGTFISPADYDSEMNTLYANAVSFSGGSPNTILRIDGIPYNADGDFVGLSTATNVYFSHLKVSPHSPEGVTNLFIGTQNGRLYKIVNAQSSPVTTEIGSNDFPTAYISCVAVGGSEDTLLVTFSNYGVPSVWQTYDGGENWEIVEGNLPDMPVRWAVYHPQNSDQALLATEIGVWSTTGLNTGDVSWEPTIDGLANVRVDMLQLRESDNTVLAATHGRGLFTAIYPLDPYTSIEEKLVSEINIYPNPTAGKLSVSFEVENTEKINIIVSDISGRQIIRKEYTSFSGNFHQEFDLSEYSEGTYLLNIQKGNETITRKILLK